MNNAPLSRQTVVITRAPEQSTELARLLTGAGARVVEVPTLTIVPVGGEEAAALDASIHEVFRGGYDGVLFTSSNAVLFFDERVRALGFEPRGFNDTTLFAIGPATAGSLVERRYPSPLMAEEAVAEGLLALVRSKLGPRLAQSRLLLPRAREGRNVLIEGLRAAGARIDVVVLYETRPTMSGPGLPAGTRIDWITFASPSAVHAFHQRFGTMKTRVACIGPVTAEAAREAGFDVAAVGKEHTAAGMVEAMLALSR